MPWYFYALAALWFPSAIIVSIKFGSGEPRGPYGADDLVIVWIAAIGYTLGLAELLS